jgi:hypothetical protein
LKQEILRGSVTPLSEIAPPGNLALRLVEPSISPVEDTMLGVVPPFDATPVPGRRIDPLVLRAVLFAIRGHKSLDVAYQSMSRREAIRRVIEPHALAYDGFRWHARAFDRESGEFRDFELGRMSKPKATAKANSTPENYIEWQTFVDLIASSALLDPVLPRNAADTSEPRSGWERSRTTGTCSAIVTCTCSAMVTSRFGASRSRGSALLTPRHGASLRLTPCSGRLSLPNFTTPSLVLAGELSVCYESPCKRCGRKYLKSTWFFKNTRFAGVVQW